MLLSMLMLLYVDDLVLLAPSRSDLTTALEELERITRRLCSAGQVFRSLKANMFSSSTESGSWGTQPASLMMSWSSSCFLRTPSRATLGQ